MFKKRYFFAVIGTIAIAGAVLIGPIMSRVETPKYELLAEYDNIQIRKYDPQIFAETQTTGTREEAIIEGFKVLADYIFGNNIKAQPLAKTAPVQQSETISMTAPVQQQDLGAIWAIRFVMPASYTLATLPKPSDQRIKLLQLPSQVVISIEFSGTATPRRLKHHQQKLRNFARAHKLTIATKPTYAFYNPPWTLPQLRRNEILFSSIQPQPSELNELRNGTHHLQ